ncbi:MAG TPA: hypothetical protein VFN94_06070 [Nitrospiria bacterium]|nr:hypothetical protein [Nitrospiria bacterium]
MISLASRIMGMALGAALAIGVSGERSAAQAASIYRGFYSLQLGMTVEEFAATTPATEVSRNPQNRVFAITQVPADIYGVTASFDEDQLAHIEVIYSAAYSARTSWDDFIVIATRKYGTGFHLPTPNGDVEMWDDGRTTLILERRDVTAQAHAYTLTLVDDAVALKRGGRCSPRIEV